MTNGIQTEVKYWYHHCGRGYEGEGERTKYGLPPKTGIPIAGQTVLRPINFSFSV